MERKTSCVQLASDTPQIRWQSGWEGRAPDKWPIRITVLGESQRLYSSLYNRCGMSIHGSIISCRVTHCHPLWSRVQRIAISTRCPDVWPCRYPQVDSLFCKSLSANTSNFPFPKAHAGKLLKGSDHDHTDSLQFLAKYVYLHHRELSRKSAVFRGRRYVIGLNWIVSNDVQWAML